MSGPPGGPGVNPMIGRRILDRYEIVSLLGQGGMGAVYKARQLSMDRMVAFKLIHPAIAGNEQVATRFHREMQAMTRIAHPNTVQVFDYGRTEDGQLFLAMEMLNGQTVSALLQKDGALPLPRLVHITTQVLRALSAAHEEGIVHRDLKPDNVMLLDRYGEQDFVKVLDFGIARFLGDGEGEGATQMTAAGALLGTPAYMSPEQALGQKIGPASDFYALGIMLYQMATGSLPFNAQTLPQLILMHARELPRPPSEVAGVDAKLEVLILELLGKEPSLRPQPAAVVIARLQDCLTGTEAKSNVRPVALAPTAEEPGKKMVWTQGQPAAEAPSGPAWPRLIGAALGLLVLGLGVIAAMRLVPGSDPVARARLSALFAAEGDPAPPAECQVKKSKELTALSRPAELLAGAAPGAARKEDGEALTLLLAVARTLGERPEHAALLARAQLALGKGDEALLPAQQAAALCPAWAMPHNLLGNAQQRTRHFAEAEAAYKQALVAAPDYVAPRYNLGLLSLRSKDPQAAILAFDEVLKRNPDHPLSHMVRGQARLLVGDLPRATADLREAVRRQPERADAWLLLGQAQAQSEGAEAARAAFCRAKELGSKEAARLCP